MASARRTRWRTSSGAMPRSRLTYQRTRPFAAATADSRERSLSCSVVSGSGISAVPDFQVEQRPQQLLVVLPPPQVVGEIPVERRRVVVTPRERGRAPQMVQQAVAHPAAKPLVDRHAEAHLGPLEDARR